MMSAFDYLNPTSLMIGRYQPWHEGHLELFQRAYELAGQVLILVREVPESREANSRVPGQDDNPFSPSEVFAMITQNLSENGFTFDEDYVIMSAPNIVDISYGRDVGYTFTEHDLGDLNKISATDIRAQMRAEGKLANKS